MAATLATFGAGDLAGRRIAVLGAMRELGEESDAFHAGLAAPIAAARIDYVILVGNEMEALAKALGQKVKVAHVADATAATRLAREAVGPGDAILVKGSNSIGLAALVDALADGPSASVYPGRSPQAAAEGLGTGKN
jgi:UDP-N-acetylmuramoyl-tripeptide--D-alanyl-D-alanine ligase